MKEKKILVFSIALEGYSNLFKDCIRSQKEYCKKYGFNYILINKAPRNLLPKEAAWLKLFLLQAALKCDYEWIAFIDADCEIRTHTPSFVNVLQKYKKEKSVFMAHGFSGRINSGVIFMRNSRESIYYLELVINNGDQEVPMEDKALYENGHMIHYGKNNPYVQIIEAEKWNNNFCLLEDSYIQHYSGGILREKYLKERPISKLRYKTFKRLRNRINNIFGARSKTSMKEIQSLIFYYSKKYKGFDCKI